MGGDTGIEDEPSSVALGPSGYGGVRSEFYCFYVAIDCFIALPWPSLVLDPMHSAIQILKFLIGKPTLPRRGAGASGRWRSLGAVW